eukprot:g5210.t1
MTIEAKAIADDGMSARKTAVVVVSCFPPRLKQGGGVSKRYLALCRALIEGVGDDGDDQYDVILLTQIKVRANKDRAVHRWLDNGRLTHIPCPSMSATTMDGPISVVDMMSPRTLSSLATALFQADLLVMEDINFRVVPVLLARALDIPTIVTTHTDMTHFRTFSQPGLMGVFLQFGTQCHIRDATFGADVHATVSRSFGRLIEQRLGLKSADEDEAVEKACDDKAAHPDWTVAAAAKAQARWIQTWPALLWSDTFRTPLADYEQLAAKERAEWLSALDFTPRAVLLFVGRWSAEKRVELVVRAVPKDCALVLVGDADTKWADDLAEEGERTRGVVVRRGMRDAHGLRIAYAAADLFVSASAFETLGNTVVESICAGTPCAVHPAQGHLEHVIHGRNGFFVDFDGSAELARAGLEEAVRAISSAPPPALAALGTKLRAGDFNRDLRRNLIDVAVYRRRQRAEALDVLGPVGALLNAVSTVFFILLATVFYVLLFPASRALFVALKAKFHSADDLADEPDTQKEIASRASSPLPGGHKHKKVA